MVDPHTAAIFDFAQLRRDARFREQYPQMQNSLVCVESDLVKDVLYGAAAHYFPDGKATLFCYYSADQTHDGQHQTRTVQGARRDERFGTIGILPQNAYMDMPEGAREAFGRFTIGQFMERAYGNIDWDGMPHFELPSPDGGP